jgi:outer membrane protein assembly factor BamB
MKRFRLIAPAAITATEFACSACLGVLLALASGRAEDWPMQGRDKTRNAVSPEKGAPVEWDVKTGRNIKWRAPVGYITWADPVVAEGLVWVGTNNDPPSAPRLKEDAPVLKCFRERDGQPIWQFVALSTNGLPRGDYLGFHSSPLIEAGHAWLTTRYGQVHCFDVSSLYQEAVAPKLLPRPVWTLDLHQSLGVWPFYSVTSGGETCSIGASYRGRIYIITGNGIAGWQGMDGKLYGLVIAASFDGFVHCLNAQTGQRYWRHDVRAPVLTSPLIVDGKVYVADLDGKVCVLALSKEKSLLFTHNLGESPINSSPIFANGVLYIAANGELFAIQQGASSPPPENPVKP